MSIVRPSAPVMAAGFDWTALYKVGAIAALLAALLFRPNLSAEYSVLRSMGLFAAGPASSPADAAGWLVLFQESWLAGLVLFDFGDLIYYALLALVFLALYGALKPFAPRLIALATASCLGGLAVYAVTNQAVAMLSFSRQLRTAATEMAREELVIAAEAAVAVQNPGAVIPAAGALAALFLVTLAGLLASLAMLRGPAFSRLTAYSGILANGTALLYFITLLVAPGARWLPPTVSAPLRVLWTILTAVALWRLGRSTVAYGEAAENEA